MHTQYNSYLNSFNAFTFNFRNTTAVLVEIGRNHLLIERTCVSVLSLSCNLGTEFKRSL